MKIYICDRSYRAIIVRKNMVFTKAWRRSKSSRNEGSKRGPGSFYIHNGFKWFLKVYFLTANQNYFAVQIFIKFCSSTAKYSSMSHLVGPPSGNLMFISCDNYCSRLYVTPTPWLMQIRFTQISLTQLFKRFPFLT